MRGVETENVKKIVFERTKKINKFVLINAWAKDIIIY